MAAYQSFEELPVWQEARLLVSLIYTLTHQDSFSRDRGLSDQIQRASLSVMTNIAEGFERRSIKEFCQFLNYAKGSSGETRSLLFAALDQDYISLNDFKKAYELTTTLSKSITGFDRYLSQSNR